MELMRRGVLRQSEKRQFTTTRQAVANYLAESELNKHEKKKEPSRGDEEAQSPSELAEARRQKLRQKQAQREAALKSGNTAREEGDRLLQREYRKILSNYFLAVIANRGVKDRTAQFQTVVVVSRVVGLCIILVMCYFSFRSLIVAGERHVIDAWLAERRQEAVIQEFESLGSRPGGKAFRVKYEFLASTGETQVADRVFIVDAGEVVNVVLPDSRDP